MKTILTFKRPDINTPFFGPDVIDDKDERKEALRLFFYEEEMKDTMRVKNTLSDDKLTMVREITWKSEKARTDFDARTEADFQWYGLARDEYNAKNGHTMTREVSSD